MINLKTCTKCNETKSVDLFYKRSDLVGKYTSHCRACKRAHDNAHYAKEETKLKKQEYQKKLRSSLEFKEKEKINKSEYNQRPEVKNRKKLKQRELRKNEEFVKLERLRGAEYAKKHPEKYAMKTRTRKAKKLQRTPKWLSEHDLKVINGFYSISAMLTRENKEPWHVDHIIPLQGKTVSGLHVPWNLQVMLGKENSSKGNRI